jgi:uncharacterized membrane protein YccC
MTFPAWRDWLFSLKAFIAAMLALGIALKFGMPRPYWAMTAVYVVANPLMGATVSKAFDRMFGTVLGAAGAVVLVPPLVNAPELLMLAVAFWTGTLLFIALHDRTPRNYVFLLAGYTLPLLALPNVDAPGTIFDVAVARSEEIILGIVTMSIVGTVLFPVSIGPILNTRIASWLRDAASWADEIFLGDGQTSKTPAARQKLAGDIGPINVLLRQMPHDAGAHDIGRFAQELRGRLLLLLPLLSSISDRLHALKIETQSLSPEMATLTAQIAAWIKVPPGTESLEASKRLRQGLDKLEPKLMGKGRWNALLHSSLIARLAEFIALWQDCLALQERIDPGSAASRIKPVLQYHTVIARKQHYDYGMMLFSAGSAVLATFVAGLIWIWSGWTYGANFTAFVAIACCFFGSLDRPAVPMRIMLIWTTIAYVGAGVYIFAILPRVDTFAMLVLALAPPFLLIGAFVPRPELSLITLLLAANTAGDLGLDSRYAADFITYANGGVSIIAGLFFSTIWTLIVKPFGAEVAVRRLVRAGWFDLSRLAAGSHPGDHAALIGVTLDRLAQIMPRLSADPSLSPSSVDGLAELRIGFNLISLQRDRRALQGRPKDRIDAVLQGVAGFFGQRVSAGMEAAPPVTLLKDIDDAFAAVIDSWPKKAAVDATDALVGIRRALFPDAPPPSERATIPDTYDELTRFPAAAA